MNARRIVLAVLCLLGVFVLPVSAQVVTPPVSTVSASGTLSKVGSAQSLPITAGQTVCVVVVSGATSFSVQPEVFTGGIWDFASGFSAITAAGTYVGVIDPTKASAFSFFVSSLGSGQTLTYTETCGPPYSSVGSGTAAFNGSVFSGSQFGQPANVSTGDGVFANSTGSGQIWLCGSATVKPFCNIDFDVGGGTNRITIHGHTRILSDLDTYGGAINLNPNNTVATPTLSFTPGGSLAQTTYYVRVTPVSLAGEGYTGNASAETSIAVPANNLLVVTTQSNVGSSSSGYSPQTNNIYVSTTSGNYTTGQQATGISTGASWTEPTTGLVSGAALPSTDNSAGVILSSRFGLNLPICSGIPANWEGAALPYGGNEYVLSNTCTSTPPAFGHNACSAVSGNPCSTTVTCSLSAATTCNATITVPANSICMAQANASDTTTGSEWFKASLSATTLTTTASVSSSQTSTVAANVLCL